MGGGHDGGVVGGVLGEQAGEQQPEHQNESGADKLAVLRKHAAKLQEKGGEGFLPFSDKSVARFVRSAERPYAMLLIFTTPNHVGCK